MQQEISYPDKVSQREHKRKTRSVLSLNLVLLFSLLVCSAVLLSLSVKEGEITPIVFFCVMYILGISLIFLTNLKVSLERGDALRIFTIIFFVSTSISCFIYLYYQKIYGIPYESGGTDDARLDMIARAVQSSSINSYDEAVKVVSQSGITSWQLYGNYAILIGFIQKSIQWIGLRPHTMIPRIFNGLILAMSSVLLFKITKYCTKSRETTNIAAYFYGLLPSILFVSAHVYRDILVGFGIIAVLYGYLGLMNYNSHKSDKTLHVHYIWPVCIFLLGIAIVSSLRTGMVPIIFICLGLATILQIKTPWLRGLIVLFLFCIVVVAIDYGPFAYIYANGMDFFNYYTQYRLGGSAEDGISRIIYSLPFGFSIPLRLLYASISPVPFPSGIASEDFRRVGTIVWYLSLPFLVTGISGQKKEIQSFERSARRTVLSFFIVFYCAVAIITMQSRQISMYASTGAILISLGLEKSKFNPWPYLWSMIFIGVAMVIMYLSIKIL
jgi:hypothetical protein